MAGKPEMPDNPVVLPGWFVRVFVGIGALAIPWASWITMTLATISIQMQHAIEGQQKREALALQFQAHLNDQSPHASALKPIGYRLDSVEKRLDAIETRP